MYRFKKMVSVLLVTVVMAQYSVSFAASNKEATLTSIDSLHTFVTSSIAVKEKALSDSANSLGTRYDTATRALGITSEEVEALTSIKKLNVPSFRLEVATAYSVLKLSMFQDIKKTQAALSALRDEVSLGYSDLSNAQKLAYDDKIAVLQKEYMAFSSGSTIVLDTFTSTFSARIAPAVELLAKMMRENGDYIRFIRDIRAGYLRIDTGKAQLISKKDIFDREVLPKIQGGFLVFTTNKKLFTDALRADLTSGLDKALLQPKLKAQEPELRAYVEDIMSKWGEYLNKNFGQDDELIYIGKDAVNLLTSEKELRSQIYDEAGSIRSLDIAVGTGMLLSMTKIEGGLMNSTNRIDSLIRTYGSGNVLASLGDGLQASYKTQLSLYRSDFTKLLEEKLRTISLEEKNHTQTLNLIDQEEKILRQNLEGATSADFSDQLVKDFTLKTNALSDGQADTLKKVR